METNIMTFGKLTEKEKEQYGYIILQEFLSNDFTYGNTTYTIDNITFKRVDFFLLLDYYTNFYATDDELDQYQKTRIKIREKSNPEKYQNYKKLYYEYINSKGSSEVLKEYAKNHDIETTKVWQELKKYVRKNRSNSDYEILMLMNKDRKLITPKKNNKNKKACECFLFVIEVKFGKLQIEKFSNRLGISSSEILEMAEHYFKYNATKKEKMIYLRIKQNSYINNRLEKIGGRV